MIVLRDGLLTGLDRTGMLYDLAAHPGRMT